MVSSGTHRRSGAARMVGGLAGLLLAALASPSAALAQETSDPAGGAALDQVVLATGGAIVLSAALIWVIARHRQGRTEALVRAGSLAERVSGLPSWAALPSAVSAVSLVTALLGMYWDISLHAGDGRDAGPLANPAHYLILAGLFGVFAAGCLAVGMPRDERPGPAAVKIVRGWYAPVGGVLMAVCGGYALTGFPLDDVWHRLFGQDVTLWGPTHLMLIGGAGMTLVANAVLLAEGSRARSAGERRSRQPDFWLYLRRVAVMGGLLIGLSTFQGEFDFGVPQFRLVFHPMLIALAAGAALVAARVWVGRGGALAAVAFFLVVRGAISLIVGPGLGETTPSLPLYAVSALSIEALALVLVARERPLTFGVLGGLLAGSVGFASEWGWSQLVMRTPWTPDLLPEGLFVSIAAGIAGGVLGALLATGLRGELPRPPVARGAFAASLVAVAALVANGLLTTPPQGTDARMTLTEVTSSSSGGREVTAEVTIDPAEAAEGPAWLTMTAWQGGGVRVDQLDEVAPGRYESTEPIPVHGNWKSVIRLHDGRELAGVPVFLPEDPAIPAPEVPASTEVTRPFTEELEILQRERKDAPAWLFSAASYLVLALSLAFLLALAWGVSRLSRAQRPAATAPPAAATTPPRERTRDAEPVGAPA